MPFKWVVQVSLSAPHENMAALLTSHDMSKGFFGETDWARLALFWRVGFFFLLFDLDRKSVLMGEKAEKKYGRGSFQECFVEI